MEINRTAIASFRILVAEDEPSVFQSVESYFKDHFAKIEIFHGSSVSACLEIIDALRQHELLPDLAILDIGLGEETSSVLCNAIRDDVPIIHYTGFPKELDGIDLDNYVKKHHPRNGDFGFPNNASLLVGKDEEHWVRKIANLARPIYVKKINEQILHGIRLLGDDTPAVNRSLECKRIGRIATGSLTSFMNTLHGDIVDFWAVLESDVKKVVHQRFEVELEEGNGRETVTRLALFKDD